MIHVEAAALEFIHHHQRREEAASPRMFLSGLWGIILGDSGFFPHFMKIGTGWQGTWRGPILELFLSPRASRVKNCYI